MKRLIILITFLIVIFIALPLKLQHTTSRATVTSRTTVSEDTTSSVPLSTRQIAAKNFHIYNIVDTAELECLQKNIYFEAAVESTAGQLAVAHVTTNRVNSPFFPNTYCSVIYQGRHWDSGFPKRDACQFSWYCDGKHDRPFPGPTWEKSKALAEYYITHQMYLRDITDGALYYHANYIANPRWAEFKNQTTKIDTHIFYK